MLHGICGPDATVGAFLFPSKTEYVALVVDFVPFRRNMGKLCGLRANGLHSGWRAG